MTARNVLQAIDSQREQHRYSCVTFVILCALSFRASYISISGRTGANRSFLAKGIIDNFAHRALELLWRSKVKYASIWIKFELKQLGQQARTHILFNSSELA